MSKRPRPTSPLPSPLLCSPPPPEGQDSFVYLIADKSSSGDLYNYSFYKIDVDLCNEDVQPMPPPLFRLDVKRFPTGMGFLAIEQEILMFGGLFVNRSMLLSNRVFVYDTSKEHSVDEYEDPLMLFTTLPPMIVGKLCPIVFKIGAQIYVLSSSFNPSSKFNPSPRVEVYDMKNACWSPLPNPPLLRDRGNHSSMEYEISAYAVSGSTIIVSLHIDIGIYMLDVTNQAAGWRKVTTLGGVDRLPFDQGAHYMDGVGMWCGIDSTQLLLRAYDFTKDDGLINARDVTNASDRNINFVFSIGRHTLGLISSALDDHHPSLFKGGGYYHPRHHLILRLLDLAIPENPSGHYTQKFLMDEMEYCTDDWPIVVAGFLMQK